MAVAMSIAVAGLGKRRDCESERRSACEDDQLFHNAS
jgi:hypothetical protein